MSESITTITTLRYGHNGLNAPHAGGDGGDGQSVTISGPPFSDVDYADFGTPVTVEPEAFGGFGGNGELTGAGGAGGAASVVINSDTIGTAANPATTGPFVLAVAATGGNGGQAGGSGAVGDIGGDGGAALAEISDLYSFTTGGTTLTAQADGGDGGGGHTAGLAGAATAELLASAVTDSTSLTLAFDADSGATDTTSASATTSIENTILTAPTISIAATSEAAYGGAGSANGTIDFTGNTITVGTGGLTLDLAVSNNAGIEPLDGTPSGDLAFSGNDFIGDGASTLDLASVAGAATIDTMANTLSIGGSPANAMTGFDSFQLSSTTPSTFIVGAGDYSVTDGDPDTIVYTPQSGRLVIENYTAETPVIEFEGFGSSLDTQTLRNDTTSDGTNTFITIAGAGSIELVGLAGTVPTGGTVIAACYGRGTRITTARGDIAIEDLAIGDDVRTASGGMRPVRWIGYRRLITEGHPNPAAVWPVLVREGAFADGVPARNLWLSPGHNVVAEGVLMPVSALLNGRTVMQVRRPSVDYWHVELDEHDIILAEGLAAESYLDTGNRCAFANGGAFVEQYPDFRPRHWAQTCLPLVFEGEEVRRAREMLLARAHALGQTITEEADARIMADGRLFAPVALGAARLAFLLPAGCASIELRSRAFVPAHVDPTSADRRVLGICARRLELDGNDIPLADEPHCAAGWHKVQRTPGRPDQRWTTGRTRLPPGTRLVVIDLAERARYWDERQDEAAMLFG